MRGLSPRTQRLANLTARDVPYFHLTGFMNSGRFIMPINADRHMNREWRTEVLVYKTGGLNSALPLLYVFVSQRRSVRHHL